jgi:hypothetical protein
MVHMTGRREDDLPSSGIGPRNGPAMALAEVTYQGSITAGHVSPRVARDRVDEVMIALACGAAAATSKSITQRRWLRRL